MNQQEIQGSQCLQVYQDLLKCQPDLDYLANLVVLEAHQIQLFLAHLFHLFDQENIQNKNHQIHL